MRYPKIDFHALRRINPDTVGWLRLADTPIDYPIVQERREGYYLSHNFSREPSRHGAVCLDANPAGVFPDRQNRLRGHNMSDGSMFRALTAFLETDFFRAHPCLDILTEDAVYKAGVWAVLRVPYAEEYLSIVPPQRLAFEKWKNVVIKRSLFPPRFLPAFEDRNAVFCTCETEGADGLAHGDLLVFAVIGGSERSC